MIASKYNTEVVAGSLLIPESRKVAALILQGADEAGWKHFIAVDNQLQKRSRKERIKQRIYKTRELARADVLGYIEVFYNRQRRHSHLGGLSPEIFEQVRF
jgi:putative transposase